MIDQLNQAWQIIVDFLSALPLNAFLDKINAYLYEIAGFGAVVLLLLLLFRTIGNRRRARHPVFTKDPDATPDEKRGEAADKPLMEPPVALSEKIPSKVTPETPPATTTETTPAKQPEKQPEPPEPQKTPPAPDEAVVPEEEKTKKKPAPGVPEPPTAEKTGFFSRLKSGLSKTRNSLSTRFDAVFSGNQKLDDDLIEEIEEVLITADIGVPTTMRLMERITRQADQITGVNDFKAALKKEMRDLVSISHDTKITESPHVIMVVGVNGVGKTTTIGKLAAQFTSEGKKVLLAAADTFRAAAVEQLEIWASRAGADIVRHKDKSDPAAVAFDSVDAAMARGIDVVIVDTAGRLHTKVNLMEELKKIKRSIGKKIPAAPHETFLVLDATTGQNAVSQALLFNEHIDISGIILTKLDGTAKGGIVLSICSQLKVPIRYIGIGEGVADLQKFDPALFVDALL